LASSSAITHAYYLSCINYHTKIFFKYLDFTDRDAVDDAIDTGDTKEALQLMKDKAENYQKRLLRHVFR
jgi:hypothetical protein